MADQAIPEVPHYLRKNTRAVEKWNVLWTVMERTRIHPIIHEDTVVQYCVAYADMRAALEHLERGKLVSEKRTVGVGDKAKTTIEKVTMSPYQTIYDNAVRSMERLGKLLGLDPLNPLEEARRFADYAEFIGVKDEDDYVDDESSTGGPGDAGTAADATTDGQPTGDAAGTREVSAQAAGPAPVLDGRTDH